MRAGREEKADDKLAHQGRRATIDAMHFASIAHDEEHDEPEKKCRTLGLVARRRIYIYIYARIYSGYHVSLTDDDPTIGIHLLANCARHSKRQRATLQSDTFCCNVGSSCYPAQSCAVSSEVKIATYIHIYIHTYIYIYVHVHRHMYIERCVIYTYMS